MKKITMLVLSLCMLTGLSFGKMDSDQVLGANFYLITDACESGVKITKENSVAAQGMGSGKFLVNPGENFRVLILAFEVTRLEKPSVVSIVWTSPDEKLCRSSVRECKIDGLDKWAKTYHSRACRTMVHDFGSGNLLMCRGVWNVKMERDGETIGEFEVEVR